MQSLSYVGPKTWNRFFRNLKSTISINSLKRDIKEYLFKKSSGIQVDIYSYA